jgi:hypothetical protein
VIDLSTIDIEALYDHANTLAVVVVPDEHQGFPYLQRKLAEILEKGGLANELMVRVTHLSDQLQDAAATQRALFDVTGVAAHKDYAVKARALVNRLKGVFVVVKLRRERLKSLTMDIRLYCRIMEDGLGDDRTRPDTSVVPRTAAVPSALSAIAEKDKAQGAAADFDVEGLFSAS